MTSPTSENTSDVLCWVQFSEDPQAVTPVQSIPDIYMVFKRGMIRSATPADWTLRSTSSLQNVPVVFRPTAEKERYASYDRALRRNADGSIPQ